MTIKIDGKNYDENKLDKKVVNSIGQIAILQKRMNDIQMDHENAKVLLAVSYTHLTLPTTSSV